MREFLVNIVLLVFINLLIKPFFIFGIDLTVQNKVGADYGLYFALLNLTYILQIVNDFGLQSFNNRNVSQHPQLMPKYFPNFLVLKMVLSGIYILFSLLLAFTVFRYGWKELPLLLILLFNNVLLQIILFLRSNVSGLGYYLLDSFLSTLDKLLMLATCSILLWYPLPGVEVNVTNFALAQTIALFFTALIVFTLLRWRIQFPIRPSWIANWRTGKPQIWMLFRKSLPFAVAILLMFSYSRFDSVILERMLPNGAFHADVYASAYRLLDACNMFGFLFATLLLPMFARQLRAGGWEATKPLVKLGFKLIWAGSITLVAAIYFAREPLIHLMMPDRAIAERWEVLGILIWVFVPVSMMYIFSTLLTAHDQLLKMNRLFLMGVLVDLLVNACLTPFWYAKGAAIATLVTHLFVSLGILRLAFLSFHWRPRWQSLAQPILFAIVVLGVAWGLFQYSGWSWVYAFSGVLGTGLMAAFLFKLIDIRQIKAILAE